MLDETAVYNKKRIRFYCQYYDEIQTHIEVYKRAEGDVSSEVEANKEFFRFSNEIEDRNLVTETKNYNLVLVNEKYDYTRVHGAVIDQVTFLILYYLVIQIIKVAYQYVVFGNINFHPYRLHK